MAKARFSRFDGNPGCSVEATLSLISGKWKGVVLWYLLDEGTLRFSELRRRIGGITQRMLTNQLRELEIDGLIHRQVHAEVPPRVEYSLTSLGRELTPVLMALKTWGDAHIDLFGPADVTQAAACRATGEAVPGAE